MYIGWPKLILKLEKPLKSLLLTGDDDEVEVSDSINLLPVFRCGFEQFIGENVIDRMLNDFPRKSTDKDIVQILALETGI